tara:strand:- start:255 stop:389 length:135 start_codon:yes stop_codon:yes gene_type:complete
VVILEVALPSYSFVTMLPVTPTSLSLPLDPRKPLKKDFLAAIPF